ncbi:HD domain-containing phosphohydrolase [Thermodesulfovibrio sp. 3907-1M]|uniref:HD domain-containing phosphohydrolase n=1 Tax=Thermodesulfovibrio autotrophicus TaxID=3118333 RepID=A0AAU8GXS7_9BACT
MDKLEVLLKAAPKITREKRLNNLIEILSNLAKEIIEVDRCSLFIIDEPKKELYTIFAHGVKEIRIPLTSGIAGHVVKTGKSYVTENAYKSKFFNPEIDRASGYITRNILAVPVIDSKGKVIGVYQAINKSGRFNNTDIRLMKLIAEFAAAAIETRMLYEKIKEVQKKVLIKLSKAAEYKDPETPNHFLRVGLISSLIAEKLGIDEERCELLMLASTMHDIGKIGIPDRILQKSGRLEPDEWEIMKKHPIIGYELLYDEESELLQMAAIIALEHHERWDGKGYPFAKKENEISLWARIVGVVDNFDTLTTDKDDRESWSIDKAVSYIEAMKEKAFDPEVVDVFFENLKKIIEIKEKYKD